MKQSEQINELAAAMAKVQGKLTGAVKDSNNPFFKSKYADLNSCWDACRKLLSENGLAVIQTTDGSNLVTTLMHTSGQWIAGSLPIKAKDDGPQAQGSGMTYARRYALAAIVGIVQVDDDAEAAQGRDYEPKSQAEKNVAAKQTRDANSYASRIIDAMAEGKQEQIPEILAEIKGADQRFRAAVWGGLPSNVQTYISTHYPKAA